MNIIINRDIMAGGGEQIGGQPEQQVQKIETGKPLDYYKGLVGELGSKENSELTKETLAPLLKAIDEAEFNDTLKGELFDEIREAIQGVTEPTKSKILKLAEELKLDHIEIELGANVEKISESINDEGVRKIFLEVTEGLGDNTSAKMVLWNEFQSVFKQIESQGEKKLELTDEALKDKDLFNFDEAMDMGINAWKDAFLSKTEKVLAKIYGTKIAENFSESSEKIMKYAENMRVLKSVEEIGVEVEFDQINVQEYIMGLKNKITDDNKQSVIDELRDLSNDPNHDQNDAIEDIIKETNSVEPEKIKSLGEALEKSGKGFSDAIIKLSNQSGLGEFVAKLFQKGGPLARLSAIFGPEFQEAISEGNLKKQKALFNLIAFSKEGSNPLSAEDFSKVSGDDLKGFFKSMDSHGIDYSDKDFWEEFTTGKDADIMLTKIRTALEEQDADYFNFEKSSDFDEKNKGFLEKLNAIPKKKTVEGADGTPVQGEKGDVETAAA